MLQVIFKQNQCQKLVVQLDYFVFIHSYQMLFWQQLQFLPRSLHLFDLLLKDVTEQVELHFKYLSRNKLLNTDVI